MSAAGASADFGLIKSNFVSGLQVSWTSTTALSVAAGSCVDSTGVKNMSLDLAQTITTTTSGKNGLDVGTVAASTVYYVHLVSDSMGGNDPYVCYSLSKTAPTLVAGYDIFRFIDVQVTDGSSHFLKNYNVGSYNNRTKFWDTAISVLSGGTATSLTPIDLSGTVIPVDNTSVILSVAYTPATANDKVSFAPYGSTATVLPSVSGVVAAKVQTGQLEVLSKLNSAAPTILYINSAAAGATTVLVCGFRFSV